MLTDRQLVRLAGAAATVGGVLRVATAFVVWNPQSAWLEAVALVIDLACLFGLLGFYLPLRASLGWVGLTAFSAAVSGLASIVGPDTEAFGIDTYQAGVLVVSAGLSLLGAQMLHRRSGSPLTAWLWIASTAAGLVGGVTGRADAGFFIGGVLFALGFFAGGVAMLQGRQTMAL